MTLGPGSTYYGYMKALELRNLSRKDDTIHYRREYSGLAVLEASGQRNELRLVFTVESRALGEPDIQVTLGDPPAWPLLPVISSIKRLVLELDKSGKLP